MLTIRNGDAQRKARRTELVAGLLALASAAAFVGFAVAGWVPALAFLVGAVGGLATCIWLFALHAEVRQRVALQVCDWQRVERLANGQAVELGAAEVTVKKASGN
jgi:hypothetical protein